MPTWNRARIERKAIGVSWYQPFEAGTRISEDTPLSPTAGSAAPTHPSAAPTHTPASSWPVVRLHHRSSNRVEAIGPTSVAREPSRHWISVPRYLKARAVPRTPAGHRPQARRPRSISTRHAITSSLILSGALMTKWSSCPHFHVQGYPWIRINPFQSYSCSSSRMNMLGMPNNFYNTTRFLRSKPAG